MLEIWYAIAALLLAVYATMDGFDFGAGIVSPVTPSHSTPATVQIGTSSMPPKMKRS